MSHTILYFKNIQQQQFYIVVQKPCKATYICGHVISNSFCLVFSSKLQSITAVILHFSNKTGSICSYLKTHFAGNALIDPILIYVIDNMIRNRLSDVLQIPGNSTYLVFAPRASIVRIEVSKNVTTIETSKGQNCVGYQFTDHAIQYQKRLIIIIMIIMMTLAVVHGWRNSIRMNTSQVNAYIIIIVRSYMHSWVVYT